MRWLSRSVRNHEQPEALLLAMWVELTYWYKTVVFLSVLSESFGLPDFEAHSRHAFPGLLVADGTMSFSLDGKSWEEMYFFWMEDAILMWDPPELFPFSTARDNIWDGGYSVSLNYSSVATQGIFVGFRWYDVYKLSFATRMEDGTCLGQHKRCWLHVFLCLSGRKFQPRVSWSREDLNILGSLAWTPLIFIQNVHHPVWYQQTRWVHLFMTDWHLGTKMPVEGLRFLLSETSNI